MKTNVLIVLMSFMIISCGSKKKDADNGEPQVQPITKIEEIEASLDSNFEKWQDYKDKINSSYIMTYERFGNINKADQVFTSKIVKDEIVESTEDKDTALSMDSIYKSLIEDQLIDCKIEKILYDQESWIIKKVDYGCGTSNNFGIQIKSFKPLEDK